MANLAELATSLEVGPLVLGPPAAAAVYALLAWDARRTGSPNLGDDQVGVKTVVATFLLVGAFHLGRGVRGLLHLLLTFERFGARAKVVFPDLVVGALVVAAAIWVLFPRTNVERYPRVRRIMAGMIAVFGGVGFIEASTRVMVSVLSWPSWNTVAAALATALTTAGSVAAGTYFLALHSGIEVPPLPRLGGTAAKPDPD